MAISTPTLDQRRARHAWEAVQKAKTSWDMGRDFKLQGKRLPVRIMSAGLGHALAFLHAKNYAPELIEAVSDWVVVRRRDASPGAAPAARDALMQAIVKGNADFLRIATDEALAYLRWLVRFADAEIDAKES